MLFKLSQLANNLKMVGGGSKMVKDHHHQLHYHCVYQGC